MDIKKREEKIQEKRKKTPFRDFVKEICCWMPVIFYNQKGRVSRYPNTGREGNLVELKKYDPLDIVELEYSSIGFFDKLSELFKKQPKMIIMQRFENENSDYAELYGGKNCYLSFGVGDNIENIAYTTESYTNITNVYNSFGVVLNCENIYSCKLISNSFKIFYSSNVTDSNNIWFSSNMIGCTECIMCNKLNNASYCINNIQYTKDEYNTKKEEILKNKSSFTDLHHNVLSQKILNKLSENMHGIGIVKSKNIKNGFCVQNITEGRNIFVAGGKYPATHFYDCFDAGNGEDNHLYANHYVGEGSSNVYCCSSGATLTNVYYSYFLENCSYCLGCIGLKNKQFCIFNKQYTKQDRLKKADEIFAQMDKDGTLGNFFPGSMNPFYFNDTAAYLIDDSFTKQEVEAEGYLRRDKEIKVDIPEGAELIKSTNLAQYQGFNSEGKREINPEILKKVIVDEKGNYYRIVKMEYDFLVKHGLPLPEIHWLDRIKLGFRFK